MKARI